MLFIPRNITSLHPNTTSVLIHIVTIHIDYCNSIFFKAEGISEEALFKVYPQLLLKIKLLFKKLNKKTKNQYFRCFCHVTLTICSTCNTTDSSSSQNMMSLRRGQSVDSRLQVGGENHPLLRLRGQARSFGSSSIFPNKSRSRCYWKPIWIYSCAIPFETIIHFNGSQGGFNVLHNSECARTHQVEPNLWQSYNCNIPNPHASSGLSLESTPSFSCLPSTFQLSNPLDRRLMAVSAIQSEE